MLYVAPVAEWLEHVVAMCKVSGLSPELGAHKNLCGCRECSDYSSFHKAVKRQWFHTLIPHDTMPRPTQKHTLQTPYTLELHLCLFPPDVAHSFPPE